MLINGYDKSITIIWNKLKIELSDSTNEEEKKEMINDLFYFSTIYKKELEDLALIFQKEPAYFFEEKFYFSTEEIKTSVKYLQIYSENKINNFKKNIDSLVNEKKIRNLLFKLIISLALIVFGLILFRLRYQKFYKLIFFFVIIMFILNEIILKKKIKN